MISLFLVIFTVSLFKRSISLSLPPSSPSLAVHSTRSPMATPPVNLWLILSESKRIINAHSRHFLALSVLFLLPVSFSATVYPYVTRLLSDPSAAPDSVSLLRGVREYHPRASASSGSVVLLSIAYIVVGTVFNLLAIGSITYSVFQGFYGRPVKLWSAVKSSFASFFPLLGTKISVQIIFFGILAVLGFSSLLLSWGLEFIGLEINFLALLIVSAIVFLVIVFKLSVNWILMWVIVVVESKWGFTPLKRSKSLVRGMRGVSLSLIIFFLLIESVLMWSSTIATAAQLGSDGDTEQTWWRNAGFILQIVITSACLTVVSLYGFAASTVMYMHCKAVHGELAFEIAEEFAREYVSLPFDDGKVPHLVTVAYNV